MNDNQTHYNIHRYQWSLQTTCECVILVQSGLYDSLSVFTKTNKKRTEFTSLCRKRAFISSPRHVLRMLTVAQVSTSLYLSSRIRFAQLILCIALRPVTTCDDPTRPRHALPHAFCSLSLSRIAYRSMPGPDHLYLNLAIVLGLSSHSKMLITPVYLFRVACT